MLLRKIYIVCSLFFCVIASNSQTTILLGANTSSLRNNGGDNSISLGFQGGVAYDIKIVSSLYIQPQFLLSYEPTITSYHSIYTESDFKRNFISKPWSASLPILLSYKVLLNNRNSLFVSGGGYLSFGLLGNHKIKTWEYDRLTEKSYDLFPDKRFRGDYGLIFGFGYEMSKYIISTQIKYGLPIISSRQDKVVVTMFMIGYKL